MRKQLAVFKMTKHLDPMASLPSFIVFFGTCLKKKKIIMVDSFDYAFQVGSLPISQKLKITSLFPKNDKNLELLKNWGPINHLAKY